MPAGDFIAHPAYHYRSVYDEIKEDSKIIWGIQRYQLTEEYAQRSVIVMPFCLLIDVIYFFKWCLSFCFKGVTTANARTISEVRKYTVPEADLECCNHMCRRA